MFTLRKHIRRVTLTRHVGAFAFVFLTDMSKNADVIRCLHGGQYKGRTMKIESAIAYHDVKRLTHSHPFP